MKNNLDTVRAHIIEECFDADAPNSIGPTNALIELHQRGVTVTMRSSGDDENKRLTCMPVTLAALAHAFNNSAAVSTGVLPDNALFWRHGVEGESIGIFQPAQQRLIKYAGCEFRLPFPPLVMVGVGFDVFLYALNEDRRPSSHTSLFYPPLPNIFETCLVCKGQNTWGTVTAGNINEVLSALWASEFTPHMISGRSVSFPSNVADLFLAIAGRDEFPYEELVPVHEKLIDIM